MSAGMEKGFICKGKRFEKVGIKNLKWAVGRQ
jgi:hypothetical protein